MIPKKANKQKKSKTEPIKRMKFDTPNPYASTSSAAKAAYAALRPSTTPCYRTKKTKSAELADELLTFKIRTHYMKQVVMHYQNPGLFPDSPKKPSFMLEE